MEKKTSLSNYFSCSNCHSVLNLNDSLFKLYFNSKDISCPNCSVKLDLWDIFIEKLSSPNIAFAGHYSLLGCVRDVSTFSISPNESIKVDLTEDVGDGDLLFVNFNVFGDKPTFPMTNVSIPQNFLFKHKTIFLKGMPLNEESSETQITVHYWFAPENIKGDLANMLLLDAFKFFLEENYRYMVISAHSAIEILQYKFFENFLKEHNVSKNKTENFLKDAATYSYQLDPLLPLITKIKEYPMFDDKILEGLKNLRKDRNNLVHRGQTDISDITKLKKELISAFFAFKYFKIIPDIE